MAESSGRTVCILAADVSGDQNAAGLAAAIRALAPDVRLVGAGGPKMHESGVEVSIETTALSIVGFLGLLRVIRKVASLFRQGQELVATTRPDLVVLVDSEMMTLPFATWLRRKRVPVVFFFPPQVWFWGRWRLPVIVPLMRRVLSAFREEANIYESAGVDTVWVGHPLRDSVKVNEDPDLAMRRAGLDPTRPLVVLMPGSRRSEVRALCAPLLGAARLLKARDPSLQFALPLATETLRAEIERAVGESGLRDIVIYEPRSYAILSRARVVLQCSGTATVETALLGIPSVIAYRCNPIEYFVGRHILIDIEFIGMPNILLGAIVQPEFFNRHLDAEHLAQEAWSLLTDEGRRGAIQERLAHIPDLLGDPGVFPRAAQAVVDLLPQQRIEARRAVG